MSVRRIDPPDDAVTVASLSARLPEEQERIAGGVDQAMAIGAVDEHWPAAYAP